MAYSAKRLEHALMVWKEPDPPPPDTSVPNSEDNNTAVPAKPIPPSPDIQAPNGEDVNTAMSVSLVTSDAHSSVVDVDGPTPGPADRKRKLSDLTSRSPKRMRQASEPVTYLCPVNASVDFTGKEANSSPNPEDLILSEIGELTAPRPHYLDRLDEEAAQVDNEHGRRLRNNRLILHEGRFDKVKTYIPPSKELPEHEGKESNTPSETCNQCSKMDIDYNNTGEQDMKTEVEIENPELPVPVAGPVISPTPSQRIRAHYASLQLRSPGTGEPENTPNPAPAPGSSWESAIDLDSIPSPMTSPELPAQHSSSGSLKTLRTVFAHPIDFKHKPTAAAPCHFCSDFRYGIYGYGETEVEVIAYLGSHEYIETGNGHRSKQRPPTRMCISCSLSRLQISRCKVHTLTAFGTRSKPLESRYRHQLYSDGWVPENPSLKVGALRTCSLCPQPGFWRCCVDTRFDKLGRPISAEKAKGRGCGLVLCDDCAAEVRVDGILRRHSVEQTDSLRSMIGRRADADFLFPGSLLHKAFR